MGPVLSPALPRLLDRSFDRGPHRPLARRSPRTEEQVSDRGPEDAHVALQALGARAFSGPAGNHRGVPGGALPCERVELREAQAGELDECGETRGDRGGVTDGEGRHRQRTWSPTSHVVKHERSRPLETVQNEAVIPARKRSAPRDKGPTSPIADRIRQRVEASGHSARSFSIALGWHPSQLTTILERLDAGGNLRSDTVDKLAEGLGRSREWILDGSDTVVPPRLRDVPGWSSAAEETSRRFKVDPATLAEVGSWLIPRPPREIDAPFVLALCRALLDTQAK